MINEILKEIKIIINFGILDNEKLTREERMARMKRFREELSVEKYSDLFVKIENMLLDDKILVDEKDLLASEFLNLLSYYTSLQDNYDKFPPLLKQLFESHNLYKRLCILLEVISSYEFATPKDFEQIILDYFDFLENPSNEFYVHYCYSKIDKLNKMILEYLSRKDFENRTFEDVINNPELIESFKNKMNELSNTRD